MLLDDRCQVLFANKLGGAFIITYNVSNIRYAVMIQLYGLNTLLLMLASRFLPCWMLYISYDSDIFIYEYQSQNLFAIFFAEQK